jgi:hypothetical protein
MRVTTAKRARLEPPAFPNAYAGYRLGRSGGGGAAGVDRRQAAASGPARSGGGSGGGGSVLTPRGLFEEYICKRRPVVLQGAGGVGGVGVDPAWKGSRRWTDAHLKRVAGGDAIRAERRCGEGDGAPFGKGAYARMAFGAFVDMVARGDTRHYMTTQDPVEDATTGQLNVLANPCASLFRHGDFPLRPAIAGNLIPATINMWFGNSAHGSSSGLHHDFHDNLYVLLRGRKRFRLYSPADAHCMYTAGAVETVHENGLIRYQGGPETFADGSTAGMRALSAANARRGRAELELEAAERDAAAGVSGAAERLERAEAEMDEALDAVMEAEMGEEGGDGFDIEEDEEDEDDEDDEDEEVEDEEEVEEELEQERGGEVEQGEQRKEAVRARAGAETTSGTSEEGSAKDTDDTPANFSRVDPDALSLSSDGTRVLLQERWPKMMGAACAVVELEAGDVLYLPAGWFHEVTSMSDGAAGKKGGVDDVDGECGASSSAPSGTGPERSDARSHLAFNYWFHPPDGDDFERPYSCDFWPQDWKRKEGGFANA